MNLQKFKTCPICRGEFQPRTTMQKCCSVICTKEQKRQRRLLRERKLATKSLRSWMEDAQRACNAYIRFRDRNLPCISCGRDLRGTYHAGHFRASGHVKELTFHECNVNGQCVSCNTFNGGNQHGYRKGLEARYGREMLEYLDNQNSVYRWTIEECKEVIEYYKEKTKELRSKELINAV